MALLRANEIKIITASGGGTLTAKAGESLLVKDIYVDPSSNDTYVTMTIKGTVVGKLRVKTLTGNHLPFPSRYTESTLGATNQMSTMGDLGLLRYLAVQGKPITFPIPSGETMTFSRYAEAGNIVVVFDRYAAGDQKDDSLNGPSAKLRRYVHYFTNAAAVTVAEYVMSLSLLPTGWPQFPVDATSVPVGMTFRILGILGHPATHGVAAGNANAGYTTYLRLIKDNEVLMDEDRNGIPLKGYVTATTNAVNYRAEGSLVGALTPEYPTPPLWLPQPIIMTEGDRLTTTIVVAGSSGQGILASLIDLAYVMEMETK